MVDEHRFRDDLYYRLNVFPIYAPPLRERPEDIESLVPPFRPALRGADAAADRGIPTETLDALRRYRWPGNVRELENLIERAVILSAGPRLTVPLEHLARQSTPLARGDSASTLELVKRAHVIRVLEETNWIVGGPRGAAARLGMTRTTLPVVYEAARDRAARLICGGRTRAEARCQTCDWWFNVTSAAWPYR